MPKRKTTKKREISQRARSIQKVERRGGARIGAGRPPGIKQVARRLISIREMTEDIIKSGKVPLRVMINNMIYYDEQAVFIEEQFNDAMADFSKRFSEEGFLKALELFSRISDTRMKGQKCAVDAAPFLHPRLSAMEIGVTRREAPRDLPPSEKIEKFSDDFRQLRSQPFLEQEDVDVVHEPEEQE